jgi:EmrB/QacA subfamily drug resistance transporter
MSDRFKTGAGCRQHHDWVTFGHARSPGRSTRLGVVLGLLCGVQFMVVLDLVVVNVALPSIQRDLGLGQSDLQWVVIAYGLTLGGFLMLGGRAADLLGRRNVLVVGLSLFTVASVGAGLAGSLTTLVASRAVQGFGAAMAAPAALSILTATFAEGPERNKALGIFGGVAGCAASVGLIVSGVLTGGPGWEWIFLVNVPIGILLVGLVVRFVPQHGPVGRGSADVLGAVTITSGLLCVVYAINKNVDRGWLAPATFAVLVAGVAMIGLFAIVERRVARPLIPLSMFHLRTLMTSNLVAALVMAAFFGTAFQTTLFLQQVLGYSPFATGAANLVGAVSSVVVAATVAARIVSRIGVAWTIVLGQGFAIAGLLALARAPIDASYWRDLFPTFLALGIGIGLSGVAVQVAAFIGIKDDDFGVAGGMVSTAQEIGAALGLAIVAAAAIARSRDVAADRDGEPVASVAGLTEGFRRGALVAAGFSVAAALVAGLLLRRAERAAVAEVEPTPEPAIRAA